MPQDRQPVRVPFPVKGIHRGVAVVDKDLLFTNDALNVRSVSADDRDGGGKRAGYRKVFSQAVGNPKIAGGLRINALELLRFSTAVALEDLELGPGIFPSGCEEIGQGLGVNDAVHQLLAFSPLTRLHLMGAFTEAPTGTASTYYAHYSQTTDIITPRAGDWSVVPNVPMAAVVFDDGDGPQLYVAGGGLTGARFARYDPVADTWEDLIAGGTNPSGLSALAVHNGELYVGGNFSGGIGSNAIAKSVAKWLGTPGEFAEIGSGLNGNVWGMASFGGQLYVGGNFNQSATTSLNRVARWTGAQWESILGNPLSSFGGGGIRVRSLLVASVGGEPERLFIAGNFNREPHAYVTSFDGNEWLACGAGLRGGEQDGVNRGVWELYEWSDEQGRKVWAVGSFNAGSTKDGKGVAAPHIAAWDGENWRAPQRGVVGDDQLIYAVAAAGGPSVSDLYYGGDFDKCDVIATNYLALWNLDGLQAFPDGGLPRLTDAFFSKMALLGTDLIRSPEELYVGAYFEDIEGLGSTAGFGPDENDKSCLIRFDGEKWRACETLTESGSRLTGVGDLVAAFTASGPRVYIAGRMDSPGPICVRWNGDEIELPGASPIDRQASTDFGLALADNFDAIVQSSRGLQGIMVGGRFLSFFSADQQLIENLGTLQDGVNWRGLTEAGPGFSEGGDPTEARVNVMHRYVAKNTIVCGGVFDAWAVSPSSGQNNILGFQSTSGDNPPGYEFEDGLNGEVWALQEFDGDLYAAGDFDAGVSPATSLPFGLARFDGTSNQWVAVLTDLQPAGAKVYALGVYDDGINGERLFIGGDFTQLDYSGSSGAVDALGVAYYDSASGDWFALSSADSPGLVSDQGARAKVMAFTTWEGSLVIGGIFNGIGGSDASYVARATP